MSMAVDLELKKAFMDLQQLMLETKQKLKFADIQIESLKRAKQCAELTSVEIRDNTSSDTKTFESVGRMFILTPTPTVLENLSTKSKTCAEKIKVLEGNKVFLEKTLKESENNIREMIAQRKDRSENK